MHLKNKYDISEHFFKTEEYKCMIWKGKIIIFNKDVSYKSVLTL